MWTFRETLPIIAPYRMGDSSWTEGQAQCFHKRLYYMLLQVDARLKMIYLMSSVGAYHRR